MARNQTKRSQSSARSQRTSSRAWSAANPARSSGVTSGLLSLIGGLGAGALMMYLLDPQQGSRRRTAMLESTNRALASTTDAINTAYEGTVHALGGAFDTVSHKARDVSASAVAAIPSAHQARKRGRKFFSRAGSSARETADSWLDSARSYVPHFGPERRISKSAASMSAAGALLLGLGAMWLFDPARGRARRAWLMQKGYRYLNETGDFMCATGRHLRNKMTGYAHEAGSLLRSDEPSDRQLAERVRSELGRIGVPGSSIGVQAHSGRVILTGRCVADDVDRILGSVRGVHGVSEIDNHLRVGDRFESNVTS